MRRHEYPLQYDSLQSCTGVAAAYPPINALSHFQVHRESQQNVPCVHACISVFPLQGRGTSSPGSNGGSSENIRSGGVQLGGDGGGRASPAPAVTVRESGRVTHDEAR